MALPMKQLIEDNSNDRQYFAMVPTMLWPDIRLVGNLEVDIIADHVKEMGTDLDIYAKWLYATLKKVCGENGGQCFLSTKGLARLAGMSEGKVSESKARLARAKLITIVSKKRSAKGQALDHIRVLDVWERNLKTVKNRQERSPGEHISESVHPMNASPKKRSPHERKRSPGETEEEPLKKNRKDEEEPFTPSAKKFTPPLSATEKTQPILSESENAQCLGQTANSSTGDGPDIGIANTSSGTQERPETAQIEEAQNGAISDNPMSHIHDNDGGDIDMVPMGNLGSSKLEVEIGDQPEAHPAAPLPTPVVAVSNASEGGDTPLILVEKAPVAKALTESGGGGLGSHRPDKGGDAHVQQPVGNADTGTSAGLCLPDSETGGRVGGKGDMWDLARATVEAREEAGGNWAVTPEAGGNGILSELVLKEFCARLPEYPMVEPQNRQRRNWLTQISSILDLNGVTPDETDLVIKAIGVMAEHPRYNWPAYASPWESMFKRIFGTVLGQLRNGWDGKSDGRRKASARASPDKMDEATAMTLRRLGHGN